MDPALDLAINACVNDTASIIAKLLKKLNEVRVFKRKCIKLGKEVAIVHQLLDSKRAAIRDLQTLQNFEACVKRVEDFVNKCKTWNVVDVSIEVFVRHGYPFLMKELYGLREVFIFDSVVRILASLVADKQENTDHLDRPKSLFAKVLHIKRYKRIRKNLTCCYMISGHKQRS
jgi:3-methyladenine DNA glycosylase AlkD